MSVGNNNNSNNVVEGLFNFDGGNVMLAASISLLIVVLFVVILHIYAKWFFTHHRRHHNHHRISRLRSWTAAHDDDIDGLSTFSSSSSTGPKPRCGLDPSTIAAIPLFVYGDDEVAEQECVICISPFEEADVGRRLPKCSHGFHIECIDMWLHSHTTCPICRSPVIAHRRSSSLRSYNTRSSSSSISISISEAEAVDPQHHRQNHDGSQEELRSGDNLIEMVIQVTNHNTASSNDQYQVPQGGSGCSNDRRLSSSSSSSSNINLATSFMRMLSCRSSINNNALLELNNTTNTSSSSSSSCNNKFLRRSASANATSCTTTAIA